MHSLHLASQNLGLYIHWPFCQSKCPYCDFNSHVRASIDEEQWQQALLKELEFAGRETQGRTLGSVFFGGGTPSLMSAQTVEALINALGKYWSVPHDIEITLEANPNSVEVQKFRDFKKAGINRVSLGIQALKSEALKFLGRLHSREEALNAIDIARTVFEQYSFDLIYARPQQTLDEWQEELDEALKWAGNHLSLYQLTIEQGTAFYTAWKRGDWQIPENDLAAQFYELTQEILENKGLYAYEVSNHARAGFECQHNMCYWRYQDYICIGPGAHGRITRDKQKFAIRNYRAPETWLKAVSKKGQGREESQKLARREALIECLMMGLRLKEGIPYRRLETVAGQPLQAIFTRDAFPALSEEGYLIENKDFLQLSQAGLQRLNSILDFLNHQLTLQ